MATKDRIYLDKEFDDLADKLVCRKIPGSESVQGVFENTRELAVFAAGLGYRHKREKPVKSQGREIKLAVMGGIQLGGAEIVDAIALAKSGEIAILLPDQAVQKAKIFEDYVNGGMEYIAGMAGEEAPLETVIDIVKSEYSIEEKRSEVLDLLSHKL